MKNLLIALLAILPLLSAAKAETLKLTGHMHWLLLASHKDKDHAIGIARQVSGMAKTIKVVSSKSGFYGVIAGPFAASSVAELKKADSDGLLANLPKDAILTQGANYIATVFEPKNIEAGLDYYAIGKTLELSSGPLKVKVSGQKLGEEFAYTRVEGTDAKGAFAFDLDKDLPQDDMGREFAFLGLNFNKATVAKLVPGAPSPQVIVTNYSGGMHCCTTTTILSRDTNDTAWVIAKSAAMDSGGFAYEDLDGDGALELISSDTRFLYAFDSYASSYAPILIHQVRGGKFVDVSTEPKFRARLVQDLAAIEFDANTRPEIWNYNGFLAGWVASKIRLGEGDAAWVTFMKNHQKQNGFGPEICTTGQTIADCAVENIRALPVPQSLARFLKEKGYGPLPAAAQKKL